MQRWRWLWLAAVFIYLAATIRAGTPTASTQDNVVTTADSTSGAALHIEYPLADSVVACEPMVYLIVVGEALQQLDGVGTLQVGIDNVDTGHRLEPVLPLRGNSSRQYVKLPSLQPGATAFTVSLQDADGGVLETLPRLAVRVVDTSGCTPELCWQQCTSGHKRGTTTTWHGGVYVYPFSETPGTHMSPEYIALLQAIRASRWYNPDPSTACAFVPNVDTLCLHSLCKLDNATMTSRLAHLPYWHGTGANHIVFHMADKSLMVNIGLAVLAKSSSKDPQAHPASLSHLLMRDLPMT